MIHDGKCVPFGDCAICDDRQEGIEIAHLRAELAKAKDMNANLLTTKNITVVPPPMQQWEVDLQRVINEVYERGLSDGRKSTGR